MGVSLSGQAKDCSRDLQSWSIWTTIESNPGLNRYEVFINWA
jgi:hypothetical protein